MDTDAVEIRDSISSYIESRADDLVRLLEELVQFKTYRDETGGGAEFEREAQRCHELLREHLHQRGLIVDGWDTFGDKGRPVTVGQLPGLEAPDRAAVAINGHVDVVPGGDLESWGSDPFTLVSSDGKLFGRGTADMKGGVAAAIIAVEAVQASGVALSGSIWLHLVTDEEIGGISSQNLLGRVPHPEAVIDPEPTELKVMPAECGVVYLRIEVEGASTHAANRYTLLYPGHTPLGASAIEKGVKILAALQEYERDWASKASHPLLPPGFNTIHPAIIMGGPGGGRNGRLNIIGTPTTISDYCSIEYIIWFLPDEDYDDVRNKIETYLGHVCELDPWLSQHPPHLTWQMDDVFLPGLNTPVTHRVVRALSDALEQSCLPAAIEGFPAASDLAWYGERGIGGTLFGPGSISQAHGANEFVRKDELVAAAKVLGIAITHLASTAA